MKRSKNDTEKRFSDDVELLLNGQEPDPARQDADYVKTLQFAQRLMTLREEPHPEFQRSLREELLNRNELLERSSQYDHNPSLFERLFGTPSLRMAVVSTFVIVAAVGLLWRAGLLSPESAMRQPSDEAMPAMLDEEGAAPPPELEEAAPQAPSAMQEADKESTTGASDTANAAPMEIHVYVEPSHAYGTAVDMSVVFRNVGPEPLSLEPFPPPMNIRQEGTSRVVRTFAAGASQLELSPMEETQYSLEWDQKDSSGMQVPAGRYELEIDTFEVRSWTDEVSTPEAGRGVATFEIAETEEKEQD